MASFIPLIITVALQVASYLFSKDKDNRELMELFYRWVEKIQGMFLKSAHLREDAQRRWKELMEKPFVETA